MAYWIDLPTFTDPRGELTVIEQGFPFPIHRVYYIYNVTQKRGGHRHKKCIQALVCLQGSCEVFVDDGVLRETLPMNDKTKCLIVETKDWHTMDNFSPDAILLVLSSEPYDKNDYIDEPYR